MKQIILLIIILLIGKTASHAQNPLITNIEGRNPISLNGKWQAIIDPYETGYYDYRYQPSDNGFFKDKPIWPGNEYKFEGGPIMNVPGDWNSQMPELLYYEGTIWYKKTFNYNPVPSKRLFLHFGAVNYMAHVYVNGKKVGDHEGGFTPFNFEVTNIIQEGTNTVIVKVDNKRKAEGVPTLNTDWWNYGGITRDVSLIETCQTYVQDYFIQLQKGNLKKISGWIKLNGTDILGKEVELFIPEARIKKKIITNEQGAAIVDIETKLTLWSPENPKLYAVKIIYNNDTITERIGFRTIETSGNDLLLNGKSIFLRGICIHEEIPQRKARATTKDDAAMLLNWATELNCNFVRLAHYPHSEYMTRLADEKGILVWSEIPVYWTIRFGNATTYELAKAQLTEMVARDKNRASVILWSVGNETPMSIERTKFLRNLAQHCKELDPTRLTTAALELKKPENFDFNIEDPLGEFIDVLGCNEYFGWYVPFPPDNTKISWRSVYNKPLIISEFGSEALYGQHGSATEITSWSEEHQEALYQKQTAMLEGIGMLRGVSPWILADFRSPKRLIPKYQDGWNRKGLYSEHGYKKKAFYVMKRFYDKMEIKWK